MRSTECPSSYYSILAKQRTDAAQVSIYLYQLLGALPLDVTDDVDDLLQEEAE